MYRVSISILAMVLLPITLRGQKAPPSHHDSSFAALQERGRVAMGVDQYTSTHHFDAQIGRASCRERV